MFPLQVTLRRKSHSDSHKNFFNHYGQWIKDLKDFEVVPQFIWITPKLNTSIEHGDGPKGRWPAHRELYVPLKKVNKNIWNEYKRASNTKATLSDEIPVHGRPTESWTDRTRSGSKQKSDADQTNGEAPDCGGAMGSSEGVETSGEAMEASDGRATESSLVSKTIRTAKGGSKRGKTSGKAVEVPGHGRLMRRSKGAKA